MVRSSSFFQRTSYKRLLAIHVTVTNVLVLTALCINTTLPLYQYNSTSHFRCNFLYHYHPPPQADLTPIFHIARFAPCCSSNCHSAFCIWYSLLPLVQFFEAAQGSAYFLFACRGSTRSHLFERSSESNISLRTVFVLSNVNLTLNKRVLIFAYRSRFLFGSYTWNKTSIPLFQKYFWYVFPSVYASWSKSWDFNETDSRRRCQR